MPDIMHFIKSHAPREHVYQAVTTADGIRRWWTRNADLDSIVGGTGQFRFYEGRAVTTIRVDALESPARVGWTTLSASAPGGWEGTTIAFELRAEGRDTLLSFAQRGSRHADAGYALVNTGWAYYLLSLQQYLETGHGARHPDKNFARMLR